MEQFSERALPATLLVSKPKVIAAGIVQEQMVVEKANTIPQPTPGGSEIQFYINQLSNTFWDCASAYLLLTCVLQMQYNSAAGQAIYGNDTNGAIIGSFYSIINRMQVWAGTVNVTDDILEVGLIAAYYLRLTMSKQARDGMSYLLGFTPDAENAGCLIQYRLKGTFPMTADGDAAMGTRVIAGPPILYVYGYEQAHTEYQNQQFQVALPLIGSLGLNNPGMYYLGLGQTKVSFFTETPANFLNYPPATTFSAVVPTVAGAAGVAANGTATQRCGGLSTSGGGSNFWVTRARLIANIIRLDDSVMQRVIALMQPINGAQLVTKCSTFVVSTQQLQRGTSGLTMIQMNIRRGSVKSLLVTFNNVGATNLASITGLTAPTAEIPNFFGKFGSINPGLGPNTMLQIENVNYPKLGLSPTQFPSETYAYILENLGLLDNDNLKPSINMQNWLVADPNVPTLLGASIVDPTTIPLGSSAVGLGNNWRSGAIINDPPTAAQPYTGSWWVQQYMAPDSILEDGAAANPSQTGRSIFAESNDFFLFFGLEDQPRPGMISGKNTQNGANNLNLNLITPTTYLYTVYMIALCDALLVHDFSSNNVYYVT